jgi:acetyl-CoA carboxylase biotin carboxyl carrier protein
VAAQDKDRSPQVITEAKELVRLLMESSSVRRVSLGAGKMKIELERAFARGGAAAAAAAAADEAGPATPADTRHRVLSPLVGTFHHQEKPGGKKLVEPGMAVKVGQPIGIIDVLGLKNPVPSEKAGVVAEVLVPDGQRVQFDEALVVIDTAGS